MQRAILHAPVARDLAAEQRAIATVKLDGATNGTRQAWCTPEGDRWAALADPNITILTRWIDVPIALRRFCILVRRSDTVPPLTNLAYKRWANLGNTDYVRTWSTTTGTRANIGPVTVKLYTNMVSTDRFHPADVALAHRWLGVPDTPLGDAD